MEDWVTIRNLHKRGKSIKEIVRTLGISRNTVRKALRSEQVPKYYRKEEINPSLAPFSEYIRQRILVNQLKGSRVLEEIKSKGYVGSKSAFYRYLKKLIPRSPPSFQPYETAPGEQALYDWSPYTVVIGDLLTKIFVYCYLLGYSRYRVYEVSLSEEQGSVFESLEAGIGQSGGVAQRVQTDNARCFVTNASRHHFQWNKHYLGLCGHYGFVPNHKFLFLSWNICRIYSAICGLGGVSETACGSLVG
jgi:transposase